MHGFFVVGPTIHWLILHHFHAVVSMYTNGHREVGRVIGHREWWFPWVPRHRFIFYAQGVVREQTRGYIGMYKPSAIHRLFGLPWRVMLFS